MSKVNNPSDSNNSLNGFFLRCLRFTPNLWQKATKNSEDREDAEDRELLSKFIFFFVVDFADAIFDLILSVQLMVFGNSCFGVFLFLATIWGRIISGLYGSYAFQYPQPAKYLVDMEMSIFSLEDGASILV